MTTFVLQGDATSALGGGADYTMIFMMIAVFAVMYFFMIRPQQKKQKEVAKWRDALQKGDNVLTAGGIYGKIKSTDGSILLLEIAKEVEIKIDRAFVMKDPSDMPASK